MKKPSTSPRRSAVRLAPLLALAVAWPAFADVGPKSGRALVADAFAMLALGKRMEDGGDKEHAAIIYQSLEQDPATDVRAEARFRLAKMASARREWREAARLLRRVLDEKPTAAPVRLALAQILSELGDESSALRELRSAQAAGLPVDVARMVDRFSDALRSRRPFGASIEVALAPDSNINVSTRSDTLGTVIGDFEIDDESQQQSGTGLALRGQFFARRPLGEASVRARVAATADLYSKKRFNRVAFEVGIGPEFTVGRARLAVEAAASRSWVGGEVGQDQVRLALDAGRPLSRTTYLRGSVGVAKVNHHFNDLQDGKSWSGSLGVEQALGARSGIGVTLFGQRDDLADPGYSTRNFRLRGLAWRELGRTTLTVTGTVGRLTADERLSLFPERRIERYRAASVGALLRTFTFRDMAPFVRVSWERNRSTIAFYDFTRKRVEFGMSRAF